MMTKSRELESLLHLHMKGEDKTFVKIECGTEFEPHGRASETWEVWWRLTLIGVHWHWLSTKGWVKGTSDKDMDFFGSSMENVMDRAIRFLKECKTR